MTSYRAARDAWRDARGANDDERLHECRKRCKDLGYQLRLLRGDGQRMLDAQIEILRDLAECLGDDHDLSLLAAAVRRTREFQEKDKRCEVVLKRIVKLRTKALGEADRLARMTFIEKPKAFTARITAYWATSHAKS
jgi:CHAD domain-containing protein